LAAVWTFTFFGSLQENYGSGNAEAEADAVTMRAKRLDSQSMFGKIEHQQFPRAPTSSA